ncbi:MAG: DUF998 domain-containing protein [Pseudonocardia sp.]
MTGTITRHPVHAVDPGTARLLNAGVVAGPLFLGLGLLQAFTVDGFDLRRHPLSLLSIGQHGWIQIANFVVTGVLVIACAVGLRRALHPGRSGTWGPWLVGAYGVGLIIAGVFVADAGAGFPPGAPEGAPPELSVHGILHGVGAALAFTAMAVACLVFARRFAGLRRWGWVAASIGTAVAAELIASWPTRWLSIQLVVATAILFAYLTALVHRVNRGLPDAPR